MMRKNLMKRVLTVGFAAVASCFVLAGCGDTKNDSKDDKVAEEEEKEEEKEEEEKEKENDKENPDETNPDEANPDEEKPDEENPDTEKPGDEDLDISELNSKPEDFDSEILADICEEYVAEGYMVLKSEEDEISDETIIEELMAMKTLQASSNDSYNIDMAYACVYESPESLETAIAEVIEEQTASYGEPTIEETDEGTLYTFTDGETVLITINVYDETTVLVSEKMNSDGIF